MKVAFYAAKSLPIHAGSLDERPLGGTETGIVRVAECLQANGHQVFVLTSHRAPPPAPDKPTYLHFSRIAECGELDCLISVQDWWGVMPQINAKRRYFWTGDSYDQFVTFGIGDRRVHSRIDKLFAVSRWQADELAERSGFPREKTIVLGNGLHLPYFEGEEKRVRMRLIYSSAPYRGLALVPPLFAQLKDQLPDLELHVFSGLKIYDTDKPYAGPEVAAYQKVCNLLSSLPDCYVHGNILQRQLSREFMKSAILFYPNTFVETSCISAMEAMAAGCVVLSSQTGGLPETVGKCGVLIEGTPGTPEYSKRFLDAARHLLTHDNYWESLSSKSKRKAHAEYGWEHVAERLEEQLKS